MHEKCLKEECDLQGPPPLPILSLRSVNVQTHLLLPIRDGNVPFGGGDDDALL